MYKVKTTLKKTLCVAFVSIFLFYTASLSANAQKEVVSYDRLAYYEHYIARGFGQDYALALAELSLKYPSWRFEPLFITDMASEYTVDYIVKKETEDPKTNLVYPSAEYGAYFDKSSGAIYDSGWYSASDDAVRYFLDPRNFLNERDIFQFEDLKYTDIDYETGVAGILEGTFMEDMILENGLSVRDHLLAIGYELSVSPTHLAARLRQEQGVSGETGFVSGECGRLLYYFYKNGIYTTDDGIFINTPSSGYTREELLSYDGYYNFFNVGASGDGMFNIYLGAMKRAVRGTPEMASEWGAQGAWNTKYKSMYGGAYSLKKSYVDDYQNTLYLQKFNVDPRSSRNFWGQYMQNIGAALSEGRAAYDAYEEAGILDSAFTFLIPVYSGMGAQNPDPSGNTSPYRPSGIDERMHVRLDYPYTANSSGSETRGSVNVQYGRELRIQGYSVHTRKTTEYQLSVDGGSFERINSYARADVREKYATEFPSSYDINAYLAYLDTTELGAGEHDIVVRALTTDGSYYQVSHIALFIDEGDTEEGGCRFDIDKSGTCEELDVQLLLRYLSGYGVIAEGVSLDFDNDGKTGNRDLLLLLSHVGSH